MGGWSDDAALGTADLLAACAAGGDVILQRAPVRTAKLFAEELRMAATLLTLPPTDLVALSPGLWLLAPARDAASIEARERLLAWLDVLGGVRLCGTLLAAAADPAGLIALAKERHGSIRQQPRWGMVYETHYPAAEMWVVPLTRVHAAPHLLIGLHSALGAHGFDAEWCGDDGRGGSGGTELKASSTDALIVLHCKHGLLLMRERPLCRGSPLLGALPQAAAAAAAAAAASAAPPAVTRTPAGETADGEGADDAALLASATPAELARWRLPAWLTPWACRGFSFSAALDPLVAIAALNIGAIAHYRYGAAAAAEARCAAARAALAAARAEVDASRARVARADAAEGRLATEWRWIASTPGLRNTSLAATQHATAKAALGAAEAEMAAATVALDAAATDAANTVAAAAHLPGSAAGLRRGLRHGPLAGLGVYDPCVGSGTVLAAAAQLGARSIAGSDLSTKNVEGAKRNLGSLVSLLGTDAGGAGEEAISDADLFEHDATMPLPPEKRHLLPHTAPQHGADLIVSNPPWGKNIGTTEDGAPIVQSVVHQFQGGKRFAPCPAHGVLAQPPAPCPLPPAPCPLPSARDHRFSRLTTRRGAPLLCVPARSDHGLSRESCHAPGARGTGGRWPWRGTHGDQARHGRGRTFHHRPAGCCLERAVP
jgi:hypothetical protein